MSCYLNTHNKSDCTGCEACVQVCLQNAIEMQFDDEAFAYPKINENLCVHCELCEKVCNSIGINKIKNHGPQRAFGGHLLDEKTLAQSTSGGAFSAIAQAFCIGDYVIFGVESRNVFGARHTYITDINESYRFRQSKYSQSQIGNSYKDAEEFLKEGYNVLFSGTPCQIGGLKKYLGNKHYDNLLTLEVICEGVPSPLFIKNQLSYLENKHFDGTPITHMNYRDKDINRWDFEVMSYTNGKRHYKCDRWFNPFWSIWLQHLMSRPACYKCEYTTRERAADVTLGDLWGIHLYCPDLYHDDRGASLVISNTLKGENAVKDALPLMDARELDLDTAIKYQSPLRGPIAENPKREKFMQDLKSMPYKQLCRKWAKRSSIKLLISKYVYGTNRQICRRYNNRFAIK